MNIKNFIQSFMPHIVPIPFAEKIRSALATGIAISLLGLALKFMPQFDYPLLMLVSIASSSAMLFVAPHSPMSQPWPLLGGNLLAALAGWVCNHYIADPLLAAGCAVSAAILLMHILHCLHPPSTATALIMVMGSTQLHTMDWQWVAYVVAANTVILLVLVLLINNLIPGRHYPLRHTRPLGHGPSMPERPSPYAELEQADIEWAIGQMGDGVIDVSEEDLTEIYKLAAMHAGSRRAPQSPVK